MRSHVRLRHIAVVLYTAILRRLWIDESVGAVCSLRPPSKERKNKETQTQKKPLDDTLLNMGPPGDRTRHTSTERTEDFSWIVDLSWHGMYSGASRRLWRLKKRRERQEAQRTPWKILFSQFLFYFHHLAFVGFVSRLVWCSCWQDREVRNETKKHAEHEQNQLGSHRRRSPRLSQHWHSRRSGRENVNACKDDFTLAS